jgi:hypothetical protein
MSFLLPPLLVAVLFWGFPAAAEEPLWEKTWRGLPELESILRSVPEGREVLERAQRKDPGCLDQVKRGNASFTESTFSRSYSLLDGKEETSIHHEVTLNLHLSLADAVVDLAHELVHYTEKGMLDPYQDGFELEHFIRNGIEGEGGELKALAVECRVAWALERTYKTYPRHRLCESYRLSGDKFFREKARQDYYALGSWLSRAEAALRKALPELSGRPVVFTSSYAAKPYPLALAEEFGNTRRAACQNNRRKYRLISSQAIDRAPASAVLLQERVRLRTYDKLYCAESR